MTAENGGPGNYIIKQNKHNLNKTKANYADMINTSKQYKNSLKEKDI